MMDFSRESSLLEPVERYIRRKGYRHQQAELPFYEYRIDVYGVAKSGENKGHTIAVELKLKKWRDAVQQAIVYQLCADYVFIAMPSSACKAIDRSILSRHGIGLLAVRGDGRCQTLLDATRSDSLNIDYRNSYAKWIMGGKNAKS